MVGFLPTKKLLSSFSFPATKFVCRPLSPDLVVVSGPLLPGAQPCDRTCPQCGARLSGLAIQGRSFLNCRLGGGPTGCLQIFFFRRPCAKFNWRTFVWGIGCLRWLRLRLRSVGTHPTKNLGRRVYSKIVSLAFPLAFCPFGPSFVPGWRFSGRKSAATIVLRRCALIAPGDLPLQWRFRNFRGSCFPRCLSRRRAGGPWGCHAAPGSVRS